MALSESFVTQFGDWVDPVRFPNGQNISLKDIMNALQDQADENGIPVKFRDEQMKSGGLFNKTTEDILILSNPEHPEYLSFAIRLMYQGKYAFMHIYNLGGSKNFGRENGKGAFNTVMKFVGGHKAKLEAEQQYYLILQDCIQNILS